MFVLILLLPLLGLAYFGVLIFSTLLAPYRFPIPYAVPIFDTPFVLAAIAVGYLCWERHRLRQDVRSAVLGGSLWLAALLGMAHILTQPDYPSTPGVDPGVAPYFFFLSYLAAFTGVALAGHWPDRRVPLSDRARVLVTAAIVGLSVAIVVVVMEIRPLLPSLVMRPGRLTPFAVWAAAVGNGLLAAWALVSGRRQLSREARDPFAAFTCVAVLVWLLGLTGFLIWPFRYSLAWYIAGLARPIGLGVIFVALMREQVLLYRELARKNIELADRAQVASADATASEQRFAELVQDLEAIVWEADVSWRFSFVSQRAERILGYPITRWLAEPDFLQRHIHSEDRERTLALIREVSSGGKNGDFEYRAIAADGRPVWLRAMIHVVPDATGRARKLRGLMVDISERRSLEGQLRHAQKMEAVGQLAGGVAHDFNNLLTVIIGQTELLREQLEGKGSFEHDIRVIDETARWGAELTRQLVGFSQKQVLQPKVLDINSVVTHMSAMLRRVIGEHIELVTVLSPGLWRVKADLGQLEQVIVNLAVNARDAMPAGGRFSIETANVELDANYHRQHPEVPQYVMLAVSDTGCGMDPQTQSRIFEPFFTTKGRGKGTGLGLFTVYGIVKQSGGTICVSSEPGRGSTFKIWLPRVEDPVRAMEPRGPGAQLPCGSETILLAEDDDEVRAMVLRTLRRSGYTVLEARDGHQALMISAPHAGPIDLLLTDMIMPSMDGRQLAERLTAIRPDLKVLYMSGYTDDVVVHRAAREHEVEFLQKPFARADLTRKVRAVLDAGALIEGHR